MRLARRMELIGTETAFEAAARARKLEATGVDVVHLEVGEPDFDTPANIRAAAKRALDEGKTHYAPFPGIPELREAIADDATARKRFPVVPEQVFVTVGGKGVMPYAIQALVDEGDEVLVPGWSLQVTAMDGRRVDRLGLTPLPGQGQGQSERPGPSEHSGPDRHR